MPPPPPSLLTPEPDDSSICDELRKSFKSFIRKVFKKKPSSTSTSPTPNQTLLTFIQSTPSQTVSFFTTKSFPSPSSSNEGLDWDNILGKTPLNYDLNLAASSSEINYELILSLPLPARQAIYRNLPPKDILALRFTSRSIRNDIDRHHGLSYNLHDGRLDFDKPLMRLGIRKLNVIQFLHEKAIYSAYFPFPSTLNTIIISGIITQRNLSYLLRIAENLQHLIITTLLPTQSDSNYSIKNLSLLNLKSLEISQVTPSILRSVEDPLYDLNYPKLTSFTFNSNPTQSQDIDKMHRWVLKIIRRKGESLKRIRINLLQASYLTLVEPVRTPVINEVLQAWLVSGEALVNLEEIDLTTNGINYWLPLINSQRNLQTLKLNYMYCGQSWDDLLDNLQCGNKLKNLSVIGVNCVNSDRLTTAPLDLSKLKGMELESLEVEHLEVEPRGIASPTISSSSELPRTLKSIKLCNFKLKPYQTLYLLLKLPKLRDLELKYWTENEAIFAGFIAVLTFLVRFDQTHVKMINLTDIRRRVENQYEKVLRMRSVLSEDAEIEQETTELSSTLRIKRIK